MKLFFITVSKLAHCLFIILVSSSHAIEFLGGRKEERETQFREEPGQRQGQKKRERDRRRKSKKERKRKRKREIKKAGQRERRETQKQK